MRTLLTEIGLFFLFPFEKFSHVIEILTGHKCFTLSRMCIRACLVLNFYLIYWFVIHEDILSAGIYAIFVFFIPRAILEESIWLENKLSAGTKNRLSVQTDYTVGRLLLLIASLACIKSWMQGNSMTSSTLSLSFFAGSIHFLACTPLPPRPKKVMVEETAMPEGVEA